MFPSLSFPCHSRNVATLIKYKLGNHSFPCSPCTWWSGRGDPFQRGKRAASTPNPSAAAHIPFAPARAASPALLDFSFFYSFFFTPPHPFPALTEKSFSMSVPPQLENKPGQKLTLFQKHPAKPHSPKSPPFPSTPSINNCVFQKKRKKKKCSSRDGAGEPCGSSRRAVSGGGGSSGRAPRPRSAPRGSRDGAAGVTGSSRPPHPPCPPPSPLAVRGVRESITHRPAKGRRGGEGAAARGARAGAAGRGGGRGVLPGTSVSEDSLAEFSIGSLGSEDLCKWKLEAMSWEGWGLKLSGSLSKFIPPLKESMAGAPGCLGEFAGVYSTQKGTRSFFFFF